MRIIRDSNGDIQKRIYNEFEVFELPQKTGFALCAKVVETYETFTLDNWEIITTDINHQILQAAADFLNLKWIKAVPLAEFNADYEEGQDECSQESNA